MFGSIRNMLTSAAFGVLGGLIASALTFLTATRTLEIEYTKQIASILPNLYSENYISRKSATVALGSYGKKAIPVLLSLLTDNNDSIKNVAIEALALSGNESISEIESIVNNRKLTDDHRGGALYALGYMQANNTQKIAHKIWLDDSESIVLKRNALNALAFLRDKNNAQLYLSIINNNYYKDSEILSIAIYGYGQISNPDEFMNAVEPHLLSSHNYLRSYIWGKLLLIPGNRANAMLKTIVNNVTPPKPNKKLKNDAEIQKYYLDYEAMLVQFNQHKYVR